MHPAPERLVPPTSTVEPDARASNQPCDTNGWYAASPVGTPWVETQATGGNERVAGDASVVLPLYQTADSLLFADARYRFDDDKDHEGNFGVGYRNRVCAEWVLGGYAYYDARWTEAENDFHQLTVGIETLSVEWEGRVNGYLVDTDPQAVLGAVGGSASNVRGTVGEGVDATGGRFEQAYWGVDAEVGTLLYAWGTNNDLELRGFVGGYHFDTADGSLPSLSGPRARAELRLYDLRLLGRGSRVTVGTEFQWDDVRGEQYAATARLRVPLASPAEPIPYDQRRILDRVVRDPDVVVGSSY